MNNFREYYPLGIEDKKKALEVYVQKFPYVEMRLERREKQMNFLVGQFDI